jgi:hypothetical protein
VWVPRPADVPGTDELGALSNVFTQYLRAHRTWCSLSRIYFGEPSNAGPARGVVFTVRSKGESRGGNGQIGETSLSRRDARKLGLALIQATN